MKYTYDGLNRLTGAYDTKSGKNWEYGYDENGNITYETVNGVKNELFSDRQLPENIGNLASSIFGIGTGIIQ